MYGFDYDCQKVPEPEIEVSSLFVCLFVFLKTCSTQENNLLLFQKKNILQSKNILFSNPQSTVPNLGNYFSCFQNFLGCEFSAVLQCFWSPRWASGEMSWNSILHLKRAQTFISGERRFTWEVRSDLKYFLSIRVSSGGVVNVTSCGNHSSLKQKWVFKQ